MTGRRSRSCRSAPLLALALAACSTLSPQPRHPLESPPSSPDLVGRLAFRDARAEDTFVDLAPELGVGYVELVAANPGVDPWLPKEGTRLVVPSARLLPSGDREGIVVNLGDPILVGDRVPERGLGHVRGVGQDDIALDGRQLVGELFEERHEGEIGYHHAVARVIDDPCDLLGK